MLKCEIIHNDTHTCTVRHILRWLYWQRLWILWSVYLICCSVMCAQAFSFFMIRSRWSFQDGCICQGTGNREKHCKLTQLVLESCSPCIPVKISLLFSPLSHSKQQLIVSAMSCLSWNEAMQCFIFCKINYILNIGLRGFTVILWWYMT